MKKTFIRKIFRSLSVAVSALLPLVFAAAQVHAQTYTSRQTPSNNYVYNETGSPLIFQNISHSPGVLAYDPGAALFIGTTANVTINANSVSFNNNYMNGSVSKLGGAIGIRGNSITGNYSSLTINSGTINFTGNHTGRAGGAVYLGGNTAGNPTSQANSIIFGQAGSTLTATGNYVDGTNNATTDGGGFLYVYGGSATFNANSTFTGNHATYHGGAIFNRQSTVVFNGAANFDSNTAMYTNASGNGGAVHTIGGTTTFNGGGSFTNNSGNWGGALYAGEGSTINLNNSSAMIFSGNTAAASGGAILLDNESGGSTLNIGGSGNITFLSNSDSGGANDIHMDGTASSGSNISRLNITGSGNYVLNSGLSSEGVYVDVNHNGAGYFEVADMSRYKGTYTQRSTAASAKLTGDVKNLYTVIGKAEVDGNVLTPYTGKTASIANTGTLTLSSDGGSNSINTGAVITGTGALVIDGKNSGVIVNNNTNTTQNTTNNIYQGSLNILSGGTFTTLANAYYISSGVINNAGTMNVTGGTNTYTINTSKLLNVTGALANNTGVINNTGTGILRVSAGGSINNTNGTIYTNASNFDLTAVGSAFNNAGSLIFTAGTNNNAISGAGTTTVTGAVTNTSGKAITQSRVTVNGAGASFTTDANDITAPITNNAELRFRNGNNGNIIDGTGNLTILAGGATVNSASVTQNNLTVQNTGSLTTKVADLHLSGAISNLGTLTFTDTAAANPYNIYGATGVLNINGAITNSGAISQDIINVIAGGALTSNASNLTTATRVNNQGALTLTGGTNNNTISGAGTTTVTGAVTNTAGKIITQNRVTVNGAGASLTTRADNIVAPITNNADLYFTNGNNANIIDGTGNLTILAGATTVNSASITQNNLTVQNAATFTTDVSDIAVASGVLVNKGTLNLGGLAGNLTYDITNQNTAGQGDLYITGGVTNTLNKTITQNSLNIGAASSLSTNANYLVIDSAIANAGALTFTGGTNANDITGAGALSVTGAVVNATGSSVSQNTITVAGAGASLTANAGDLTAAAGITNNAGLIFNGGNNANTVTGTGSLTVSGAGVTNTGGDITQANLTVNSGASFATDINDITISASAITNDGTLSFSGTGSTANDITSTGGVTTAGVLHIEKLAGATVITNTNEITQSKIMVDAGAQFITAIDDITLGSAGIENEGSLTFTDASGANANNISGDGELNISGVISNTGNIAQDELNIASGGSLTTNAGLLTIDTDLDIANGASLIFTGGDNQSVINNSGTLHATGALTGGGRIANANTAQYDGSFAISGITYDGTGTGGVNGGAYWTEGTSLLGASNTFTGNAVFSNNTNTAAGGTGGGLYMGPYSSASFGGTATFSGNSAAQGGALYMNGGSLVFNDAASFTGNSATGNGGAVYMNGGTLEFADTAAFSGNTAGGAGGDIYMNGGTLKTSGAGVDYVFGTGIAGTGSAAIQHTGDGLFSANMSNYTGTYLQNAAGSSSAISGNTSARFTISAPTATSNFSGSLLSGGTIANAGALTFSGADNVIQGNISGAGTTVFTGKYVNTALISQENVSVAATGNLTTALNNITLGAGKTDFTNLGSLTLTDGVSEASPATMKYNVTNGGNTAAGALYISGHIDNSAALKTITQNTFQVNQGGSFKTAMASLSGVTSDTITNKGTLTLTDTTSYALTKNITNGGTAGTGTLNIGGIITNTGAGAKQITQNNLNIATTGDLSSDVNRLAITNDIRNDGALRLYGTGALAGNITQTSPALGNLYINGAVTNYGGSAKNIAQNSLTIAETGDFVTDYSKLSLNSANIINDGRFELYGTAPVTLTENIVDSAGTGAKGHLVINQAIDNLTSQKNIIQKDLTVNSTGSLASYFANLQITNDITNDGLLNLYGNTDLTANIKQSAANLGTTVFHGTVTNTAGKNIAQNELKVAATGDFSTDYSDLSVNGNITNDGALRLSGGVAATPLALTNNILNSASGNGDLYITGHLTNSANRQITQDTVNISGALTTNAGYVSAAGGIANSGALTFTGGTNANDIANTGALTFQAGVNSGTITGAGTTVVTGAVTNTHGASVTQNAININSGGTLTSAAADLHTTAGVTNNGNLVFNGATPVTNTNVISGTGNLTVAGMENITNSALITQNNLTINNGAALTSNLSNLAINTANAITNDGTFKISGAGSLANEITNTNSANGYLIIASGAALNNNNDLDVTQNKITVESGAGFTSGASELTAYAGIDNLGTLTLEDGTNANAVNNSGTLNLLDVTNTGSITNALGTTNVLGDVTNSGSITQGALNIAATGALTTNASLLAVSGGIANSGALTFTGGTNNNGVTGTGALVIDGAVVNTHGKGISQDTITVNSGKSFTADSKDLTAATGITNDGTLTFNGAGAAANNNVIDGAGTLVIAGSEFITNNASITQDNLTINGGAGLNTDILDINIADLITNNGTFELYGTGALSADITGSGPVAHTIIMAGSDITNSAEIEQVTLTVESTAEFTSSAGDLDISNRIENAGTLNLTDGANGNSILNTGVLNLGDVTNTANIANAFGTTNILGDTYNSGLITQNYLYVTGTGSLTTGADKLVISNDIDVASGGTLAFNSGDNNSNINNSGTLIFDQGGSVNNYGTIKGSGAEGLDSGHLIVKNGTSVYNQNVPVHQKGFEVEAGAEFRVRDGRNFDMGADGVTINGKLWIEKYPVFTTGDVNIGSSGILSLNNPTPDSDDTTVGGSAVNMTAASGSQIWMDVFASGTIANPNNDKIVLTGIGSLDNKLLVTAGVGEYKGVAFELITGSSLSGDLLDDISAGAANNYNLAEVVGSVHTNSFVTYEFLQDGQKILLVLTGVNASTLNQIAGLTFNQDQVSGALDRLSISATGDIQDVINTIVRVSDDELVKADLSEISPYFLANVLRARLNNDYRAGLYRRIRNYCPGCSNNGIWLEGDASQSVLAGNENSINDFKITGTGVKFGVDRYFDGSDFMLGVFGSYDPVSMKQNSSKADVDSFGLGVYGGLIKEKWEIKGLLGASMDSYDVKRKINTPTAALDRTARSSFDGMTFNADIEAALKMPLSGDISFRPFIGVQGAFAAYDGFTEKDAASLSQKVDSGSSLASSARIGAGVGGAKGKLNWGVSAEADFVLAGAESEIESAFVDTNEKFKTRGAETGSFLGGINAGVDYSVTQNFNVFLNGGFKTGSDYKNMNGSIGIRYVFCGPGKAAPAPVVIAPEPEEEVVVRRAAPEKVATTYYAFDRYTLTPAAKEALDKAAAEIKNDPGIAVVVIGHTDSVGAETYNQGLSERRAKSAYDYLKYLGIEDSRIAFVGKGENEPVADNATKDGRALNRRVEVLVF